jgi:uncharacterized protein
VAGINRLGTGRRIIDESGLPETPEGQAPVLLSSCDSYNLQFASDSSVAWRSAMNWLNLFLLALLTAGHTALVATVINRLHSLGIARHPLRRFRRSMDALIVVFPFMLLWFVGLHGARVLLGGAWTDLQPFWKVYLGLCSLGLLGLVVSTVRWTIRRAPAVQVSNHSRTVDIAARLGYKPFGPGPWQVLGRIPGNEIFQVQVSDKRYALPGCPAEWQQLSILHLTDTHFVGNVARPFFDEITRLAAEMRPDLVVFTGDLLDEIEYVSWLPETIGGLTAPLGCYYVLGNHDWFVGPEQVRAAFDRCGWHDVAGRVITLEHRGRTLEIAGTERPWMGKQPPLDAPKQGFRLLLSHTPDQFSWARRHQVDLMLAGHVHGGQVTLPVIGPVFAPSRHGVRYASGAFWAPPTLLYVSRGIAGRHPLRLNCPPELTRIVLEPPGRQTSNETPPWGGG